MIAGLVVLTVAAATAAPTARPATLADVNARARAAGNRPADAVALGRALLTHTWPAQVTKIRIDAVGSHAVAGLVLSGVKFHEPLDAAGFANEVATLVEQTFAHSGVEEVDVWATVPLDVPHGEVVAGDFAMPTSRIVFSVTVRRRERDAVRHRLQTGDGVYWARDWKAALGRRAGATGGQ